MINRHFLSRRLFSGASNHYVIQLLLDATFCRVAAYIQHLIDTILSNNYCYKVGYHKYVYNQLKINIIVTSKCSSMLQFRSVVVLSLWVQQLFSSAITLSSAARICSKK